MIYVRTKNEIISLSTKHEHLANDYDPIQVADTIEELCDEFIVEEDYKNHKYWITDRLKEAFDAIEFYCMKPSNIYGAIWTDKGLIYVAKINKERELELL